MATRRARPGDAGFTITELMVTVVIIAVLAAVSAPMFTRDRMEDRTVAFANSTMMDLQRSKFQAVGTRLPMHVHVFSDRIEFRESQGSDAGPAPPTVPTLATPAQRVLRTPVGVVIHNVTATSTPIPALDFLTTATFFEMQIDGLGRIRRLDNTGTPIDQMTYIWMENKELPAGHPKRRIRLDISPLTGVVQMRDDWNIL